MREQTDHSVAASLSRTLTHLSSLSLPPCVCVCDDARRGLLELSKSFLDPFGNEGYPGQNIRVDVLVSELNFGSGSRWTKAGALLPDSH